MSFIEQPTRVTEFDGDDETLGILPRSEANINLDAVFSLPLEYIPLRFIDSYKIYSDTYLYYESSGDITGTNQDLNNMYYKYGTVNEFEIGDTLDKPIESLTGLYNNRFLGYLDEPISTGIFDKTTSYIITQD